MAMTYRLLLVIDMSSEILSLKKQYGSLNRFALDL